MQIDWPLVAVAIDKDKTSESVFRWALDNMVARGQTLIIIHVNTKSSVDSTSNNALRKIFIPYRCFCSRRDVHCKDIVLEHPDVAKAIVEFVSQSSIENLVIGESPKGGFYGSTDLSSSISKAVPDFCTVIVISKGKISSARSTVKSAPPPLRPQIPIQANPKPEIPNNIPGNLMKGGNISSTRSYENAPSNSQTNMVEEVEEEMRQLRLELKQTMEMYNSACKEAITSAKQKAKEFQRWKMEEEKRMREARVEGEVTLALVETEKAKCVVAVRTAEASKRIFSST